MKTTVAIFDAHPTTQSWFKEKMGEEFELVLTEAGLTPETVSLSPEAEVISVHVSSDVTAEVMQKLPKLKHIACRSTGYDNIDLGYAKEHGISISTVPSYGESTVAEFAFMLMLALSRRLIQTTHSVQSGEVVSEKLTGHDLDGKTLGIVGTGRIGRHAAKIARGFGLKVIASDPKPQEDAARDLGFSYVSFDDLLRESDYITLHAPATPETHHLIGKEALAKVKPGVFLINTARGSLVDTEVLIDALTSGVVAGAGLDVLEGEEFLQFAPEIHLLGKLELGEEARQVLGIDILSKLPNVLITSHNAYNSAEALGRIRDATAANVSAWHTGQPQNLVSL